MNEKQIFRYWVEIRELASGSVRTLPLTAVVKICLARPKQNEAPIPNEQLLHLKDGTETLEAKSFDGLRARLRNKYPDEEMKRSSGLCTSSATGTRRSGARGRWTDSLGYLRKRQ
jgi:hypothetical protein